MRERKHRWELFNLYDYQGVERHLNAMAARGWQLESVGSWLWKYRRTETPPARYAVTYSWEASPFNPGPTEGQQSLAELCAAAGWRKVAEWHQMEIFAAESPEAVPLETDEALRLEGLHRAMKRGFLPCQYGLAALGLLITAGHVNTLIRTPLRFFSSNGRMLGMALYGLVLLLVLINLGSYLGWRKRSLRSIAQGGGCAVMEQGYLQIGRLALALTAVLVAGDLLAEVSQAGGRYAVFFLVNLALIGLLCALVQGTRTLLRRRGVSRKKNIAATLTVDVVLTFALVGGITWGVLHFRWFTQESASYVYEGQEWDVHPENLPLTLEKMTGATYDHVRRDKIRQGSFLLGDISCWETAVREGEQFSLHYEIMEPKTAWLYRLLLEDLTEQRLDGDDTLWSWRPADPAPWGAAAAYRRYRDDAPRDAWLLCWSDRIVSLHPEREPAAAEMARIGQALKS